MNHRKNRCVTSRILFGAQGYQGYQGSLGFQGNPGNIGATGNQGHKMDFKVLLA